MFVIENRAFDEIGLLRKIFPKASAQIIKRYHLVALLNQALHDMRPDESRSSRN